MYYTSTGLTECHERQDVMVVYVVNVEPYSIHGSFLKLEYLKTEFNADSGIVKVTSHSCRIMVNLSINDYFEVMRHP